MTAFVTALNTRTGKEQSVPAVYVDNPHIFDGRFTRIGATAEPEQAPKPRNSRAKNSRRKAGTAETQAASEVADTTTSSPPVGEPTKE